MLRRRIFSSAMASVMALSSIAVVANAEETAVANVKTKEDLEAYVKSFDAFRASDIYEYGSISGEQFLNAIEYADNVLADDASSAQDYTVAYDMIESIYNRLKIYSVEELKVLIAKAKGAYDRGNILNEDLNDLEYVNDKDQYFDFASAYEEAEGVLDSSDSRLITDAYELLESKFNALVRCDIVTKAQFRAALKDYETMLQKEFDHEAWRRGTISSDWNAEVFEWWRYQGVTITFGGLYNLLDSWTSDIYEQYEVMDQIKTLNKTSDADIVAAYKNAKDALAIVSSWQADDTDRAVKANVTKLLEKYHNVLLFDYDADAGEEIAKAFKGAKVDCVVGKDANYGSWTVGESTFPVADESTIEDDTTSITKTTSASIKIEVGEKNIYLPVTKDGYWDSSRDIIDDASKKDGLYKTLNRKKTVDVAQYVRLENGVVTLNAPAATAAATTAGDEAIAAIKSNDVIVEKYGSKIADAKATVAAAEAFYADSAEFAALDAGKQKDIKKAVVAVYEKAAELFAKVQALVKEAEALLAAYAADAAVVYGASDVEDKIRDLIAEIEAAVNELTTLKADAEAAQGLTGGFNGWCPADAATWWNVGNYINGDAENTGAIKNLNDLSVALAAVIPPEVEPNRQTVNSDDNAAVDGGSAGEYTKAWGTYIAANTAYQVDLETGATLAQFYLSADKDTIKGQEEGTGITIYDIDTNDIVGAGKAYGSSLEWTLIHRYLKYALSDKYDAPEAAKYTKADVVALIDKAYTLCEDTGDAALFEVSHNDVAELRKAAIEWLKLANKDKMYKDGNTYTFYAPSFAGLNDYEITEYNSTAVYEKLMNGMEYAYTADDGKDYTARVNGYAQLEKEYNAFKYSFGDIAEKIYLYEDMIDAGELEATDELVAAIEETAYRLAVVKTLVDDSARDLEENDAFSSDRFFQPYNRVFTNGADFDSLATAGGKVKIAVAFKDNAYGPNGSHYDLQVAFEALEAEVKKQTEVTVLKGDVNGDGVVNAFDASALLKNIVNSVEMDAAVADYDANGVVNALDASAILKAIVNA